MFRTDQIYSASELIRNFAKISKRIMKSPQALLIKHKPSKYLVLVHAEIYEDLLDKCFRYETSGKLDPELEEYY